MAGGGGGGCDANGPAGGGGGGAFDGGGVFDGVDCAMNMSDCDSGDFAHAATVLSMVAATAAAIAIRHDFSNDIPEDDIGTIHLLVVLEKSTLLCTRIDTQQNIHMARGGCGIASRIFEARKVGIDTVGNLRPPHCRIRRKFERQLKP